MSNAQLRRAKREKNDEFYTQLRDIELELKHYKKYFKDATVYCNCDDPYESNFFKYFALNFNSFGLKKLITTSYVNSSAQGGEVSLSEIVDLRGSHEKGFKHPYKVEITEVFDVNHDGAVDLTDVELLIKKSKNVLTLLEGDGDFRSPECTKLLEEADIVVTNPPLSLFREYLSQLVEYNKKFIIIGNDNAVTYKNVFKLIKEDKIWKGITRPKWFKVPEFYEKKDFGFKIDENGQKWRNFGNVCWFTNLVIPKRHEIFTSFMHFSPEKFPKYDNYDAINVDKTC
jgi:hypothetical protein